MRRAAGWVAVAAFVVLVVVGVARQQDPKTTMPNSHGTWPQGYRALFETLAMLGFPVSRGTVADAPSGATVWWIGADICRATDDPLPWPGLDFARRGGTAVALLTPEHDRGRVCRLGEDLDLIHPPLRSPKIGGPSKLKWSRPAKRLLLASSVRTLKRTPGWRVVAGGRRSAFVLDRPLGRGRIVVVADATPFSNRTLDAHDDAALAVDLVRTYGTPIFDEAVALRQTRGMLSYLAQSPAAPLFAGLVVLAVAVAWHGALVPGRILPALDDQTPRLDAFVDSIAVLYGRTGDHARVLDRYRELVLGALRRHFSLAPEVATPVVIERVERRWPQHAATIRLLAYGEPVHDEAGLRAATARLDRLLEEVA